MALLQEKQLQTATYAVSKDETRVIFNTPTEEGNIRVPFAISSTPKQSGTKPLHVLVTPKSSPASVRALPPAPSGAKEEAIEGRTCIPVSAIIT